MAVNRVGAQIGKELVDLTRKRFRCRGQLGRRREHRCRGLVGLADGVAERTDVGDQRHIAVGGQLRVRGDLAGGGILLSDRAGDVRRDFIDVAHGIADFADRIDCIACRCLDHADVLTYFSGRLGGLPGQSLDLVRDHREAATGLAGASGFDRRIQRQKIGLLGDRLDRSR